MKTYIYKVENITTTLNLIKKKASENDATVTGDESSGTIAGNGIVSNYRVVGNTIKITVTEKPALIPWSVVEQKLDQYIK